MTLLLLRLMKQEVNLTNNRQCRPHSGRTLKPLNDTVIFLLPIHMTIILRDQARIDALCCVISHNSQMEAPIYKKDTYSLLSISQIRMIVVSHYNTFCTFLPAVTLSTEKQVSQHRNILYAQALRRSWHRAVVLNHG